MQLQPGDANAGEHALICACVAPILRPVDYVARLMDLVDRELVERFMRVLGDCLGAALSWWQGKTGGRRKGTLNKRTVERQRALEAIKASGKDPVTFFAGLLRNESAPLELRFQAAKELALSVHPKSEDLALSEGRTEAGE